ncbi:MAG: HPr family phosphocarrier protein [Propionibacteriaceae bacterium]|jgi:phosphocarrier protein FPr|nr:HPr family phosphocarrier protein [Propionibacteriaceae bacterium]
MIGIVVVSHSHALAVAAVDLALEMVKDSSQPMIQVAAGLDEQTFGTDASAIAQAISQLSDQDGVLVMVDLGSAILSAEMALEFLEPALAGKVVISPAPLVEGLVAAVVTASGGADLAEVDQEARLALSAKQQQLAPASAGNSLKVQATATTVSSDSSTTAKAAEVPPAATTPADEASAADNDQVSAEQARQFRWTIRNPHGLHARPAARLVTGLRGLQATISFRNASSGAGPASGGSLMGIEALGLRHGDQLVADITGPDAQVALDRLTALAQNDFGDTTA